MKYFIKTELDKMSEREINIKLNNYRTTFQLELFTSENHKRLLEEYTELTDYHFLRFESVTV
jgi:hypothetical protein